MMGSGRQAARSGKIWGLNPGMQGSKPVALPAKINLDINSEIWYYKSMEDDNNRFYIDQGLSIREKLLDCIKDLDSVSRQVGAPQKEALLDWAKCWGGFLCNDGSDFIRSRP